MSSGRFKNKQQNNKNVADMSSRPMQINKKEDMDKDFEERIIDWTTFY